MIVDPPRLWVVCRRSDDGGQMYLTGSRRDGVPMWSAWWHRSPRYATAAEALDALRLHTPPGEEVDWIVSRISLRCLRTS